MQDQKQQHKKRKASRREIKKPISALQFVLLGVCFLGVGFMILALVLSRSGIPDEYISSPEVIPIIENEPITENYYGGQINTTGYDPNVMYIFDFLPTIFILTMIPMVAITVLSLMRRF